MKGALKLPRAKQNVNIQPENKQPKQTDEIDYKAKNAELEEKINMLMAMIQIITIMLVMIIVMLIIFKLII